MASLRRVFSYRTFLSSLLSDSTVELVFDFIKRDFNIIWGFSANAVYMRWLLIPIIRLLELSTFGLDLDEAATGIVK